MILYEKRRMGFGLRRHFWADIFSLSFSHGLSSQCLSFCSWSFCLSLFSIHLSWNCLVQPNFPSPSYCLSSFFAVAIAFWSYICFCLISDHFLIFSTFIFYHVFLYVLVYFLLLIPHPPSFHFLFSPFTSILLRLLNTKLNCELAPQCLSYWLLTKCPPIKQFSCSGLRKLQMYTLMPAILGSTA